MAIITRQNLHHSLIIYPDNDPEVCKNKWMQELEAESSSFHKTQVIQGREEIKRLQFGVGTTIISSTSLKRKILKWMYLAENEVFKL